MYSGIMEGEILVMGIIIFLLTSSFGTAATKTVDEDSECPGLIIKNEEKNYENSDYYFGLIVDDILPDPIDLPGSCLYFESCEKSTGFTSSYFYQLAQRFPIFQLVTNCLTTI